MQVHAAIVQQLIDYGRGTSAAGFQSDQRVAGSHGVCRSTTRLCRTCLVATTERALLMGLGMAAVSGCALASTLVFELWLPALPVTLSWVVASLATFAVLAVMRQRSCARSRHSSPATFPLTSRRRFGETRDVILKGGKPAPMKLYATVLFVDMAGSTAVGGGACPVRLHGLGREDLDAISRIAAEHGGFVEKFTGDGMMVVFGAPLPHTTEKRAPHGRRRSLQLCAGNRPPCQISQSAGATSWPRTGSASAFTAAPSMAAPSDSSGTLRYNVMGDTVNVAARIEAFGKRIGDRLTKEATICLSGETAGLHQAWQASGGQANSRTTTERRLWKSMN